MQLSDFDYALPPGQIAQHPPSRRDESRLLVVPPAGPFDHRAFRDLDTLLRAGDLLVLNDTRVVPARLFLHRESGGKVEALLVRRREDGPWETLLKTSRQLAVGDRLRIEDRSWARIVGKTEGWAWLLEFDQDIEGVLARLGRAPLPPYIKREAGPTPEDLERYQTVYAANPGAIAAPTAGLHFTPDLLKRLEDAGVQTARLTLHVGTGTFKPVKVDDVDAHRMDPERYSIPPAAADAVRKARKEKRRVVAVGTTACRALESWMRTDIADGETDLFIRPPFEFKAVDALVTNFHVPKSTLLMLVCAFSGRERILAAYAEAVAKGYRFFSYGDASLLTR